MRAELNADANADDEIDERDGVQADFREGHGADDVDYDHGDCEGDDQACGDGAEQDGGEDEDDGEGGAEEGAGEADDGGVLIEEDVEFGVGEYFDGLVFADCVGDAAGRGVGGDEVALAS